MSNEAMELYSIFRQWYRHPKYCNYNNYIGGLAYSFIKKQMFTDDVITELLNNNIIEQFGNSDNKGYRLTQEAINDYMTVKQ